MHSFNHRRCTACGELAIKPMQRFFGGWFFIRCPNCRRQLRVDPLHGQRWILLTAFVLIAVGVGAMFGMSAMGGIGGNSGRSIWWILLCLPYPVGWILGLIGAASKLREPRHANA